MFCLETNMTVGRSNEKDSVAHVPSRQYQRLSNQQVCWIRTQGTDEKVHARRVLSNAMGVNDISFQNDFFALFLFSRLFVHSFAVMSW
jgi:hypothetical protein